VRCIQLFYNLDQIISMVHVVFDFVVHFQRREGTPILSWDCRCNSSSMFLYVHTSLWVVLCYGCSTSAVLLHRSFPSHFRASQISGTIKNCIIESLAKRHRCFLRSWQHVYCRTDLMVDEKCDWCGTMKRGGGGGFGGTASGVWLCSLSL